MDKIMKLAELIREAREMVDEINKNGEYNILSAGVDMNEDDAFADNKQAEIFFFDGMPDFGADTVKKLINNENGKITYKHSVTVDGVKFYHLVTEGENNASVAV